MTTHDIATPEAQSDAILLPPGWIALAPEGADPSAWVEAYLDGLTTQPTAIARAQLRYGLLSLIDMAAGMRPGKRYSFAFVEDPTVGLVRALLSLQMLRVTGDAFENYRARLETSTDSETVEVINRTVQRVELAAGSAWLMHDFTLSALPEAIPDPALERAVLGLFVRDADVMIEFSMYAQDLAVFDNMPQYLVDIVAALDISGVN